MQGQKGYSQTCFDHMTSQSRVQLLVVLHIKPFTYEEEKCPLNRFKFHQTWVFARVSFLVERKFQKRQVAQFSYCAFHSRVSKRSHYSFHPGGSADLQSESQSNQRTSTFLERTACLRTWTQGRRDCTHKKTPKQIDRGQCNCLASESFYLCTGKSLL